MLFSFAVNKFLKAKHLLPFFFLLLAVPAFAQTDSPSAEDGEFNVFLLTFAAFFICLMIGAAIVGAVAATLFLLLLFALIGFGMVSSSIAVGLYKRSASAAFKTFLLLVFGAGCAVPGTGLSLIAHHLYPLHLSLKTALPAGFVAGAFGGIIMALSLFTVVQTIVRTVFRRFAAAS